MAGGFKPILSEVNKLGSKGGHSYPNGNRSSFKQSRGKQGVPMPSHPGVVSRLPTGKEDSKKVNLLSQQAKGLLQTQGKLYPYSPLTLLNLTDISLNTPFGQYVQQMASAVTQA